MVRLNCPQVLRSLRCVLWMPPLLVPLQQSAALIQLDGAATSTDMEHCRGRGSGRR